VSDTAEEVNASVVFEVLPPTVLTFASFPFPKLPLSQIIPRCSVPNTLSEGEWAPLKGRPYHDESELELTGVSGSVKEFQNRAGSRYRCVIEEGGIKHWFTLRTNRQKKRVTRAAVKTCCKKFEIGFGSFVDRAAKGAGPQ
jgi:hypothetical protein